ncbi:MAG: S-layer family protein, partial [Nevskia sp.]|nr:S-layer family protein [Nevskia sp.]
AADTHIVGGEATLAVGFHNGVLTPVGSFTAGGVELDGYGFVGTVIDAGQIDTGVMSVSQQSGSYFSNDPTRTATTLQWSNPGVGILLNTGSPATPSLGQSITITAAGPVALGLNASLSGDFTLNAASVDATLPGLVLNYNPPLEDGIPTSFASPTTPPPDLALPGLNLSAANITIGFTSASSLPVFDLSASGMLSIDGAGAGFAAGSPVLLTGGTVSITHVSDLSANGAITIGATSSAAGATALDIGNSSLTASGPITLTSAGGITVSSAMLSAQGSLSLTGSGNAVSISGASLSAANTTVTAHSGLTVSNSTIAGNSSGAPAANVMLDAVNGTLALSNATVLGHQIGLDGAGGASISLSKLNAGTTGSVAVASSAGQVTVTGSTLKGAKLDISGKTGASVDAASTLTFGSSIDIASQGATVIGGVLSTPGTLNVSGGSVSASDLTGATVNVVSTAGGITVGNVDASANTFDAVKLQAANGLTAGDITASGMYVLATDGNITLGNLKIGTGDFTLLSSTSASGAFQTVGNIDYAGAGGLSFYADNTNFTFNFGNINAASLLMSFSGNETVHIGNVTSPGNVTIGTNLGALTFGNISGNNIDISTNHDLSFSGLTLDAAGNLTVAVTGALGVTSSTLYGQNVGISGTTGLNVSSTTITGSIGAAANSITLGSSAGDVTLTSDTLTSTASATISAGGMLSLNAVTIDPAALNLTGTSGLTVTGSSLTGGPITLDATAGAVTVSGSTLDGTSLTIDAATGIGISADSKLLSTSFIDLASTAGSVTLGGNLNNGGAVSISGGSLSTGNLSGSSIDLTATSGDLDTGTLTAGTNITLTASKGLVDVAGLMTLGTAGNGALQVTGLGVTTQDIVNDSPLGAVGTANDMSITATNGSIVTGNVSTAGVGTVYLVLSATGGSISTGNIDLEGLSAQATGDVSLGGLVLNSLTPGAAGSSQVTSSGGSVAIGTFTSNHGLNVNAAGMVGLGSAQVSGNLGVTGGGAVTLAGASVSGGITVQGASVAAADLSGATVKVTSTSGSITVGNVSATAQSTDPVMLQAANGLTAGDITSNGMYVLATDGNIILGNLKIGTGDFTLLSSTSAAGAFQTVGNIDYAGAAGLTFSADNHNFTFNFGNINVNSLSMSFNGNETVHLGNVTSPGNVTIGTNQGALSFGNISGDNVAISTNHDLSFSGLTLDAAGNLTLAITGTLDVTGSGLYGQNVSVAGSTGLSLANTGVGGTLPAGGVGTTATSITLDGGSGTLALTGTTVDGSSDALSGGAGVSLGNSLVSGGGNAPATSVTLASANGALALSSSSIAATGIAATAPGGITLNNSVLSNGPLTPALVRGNAAAAPGISLSSTGDITVTGSTVSGTALTLGGNNIHFANGSLLTGTTAVSLTAGGRLDASGGASTINAGALSARAALINLSDASLVIGTGIASFGSDPGLLQQLRNKAPSLLPLSSGPNASFYASGPGGITLGKISLAGGYLFAQGQTLTMTSPTGAANIFVDYLPLDPAATLNLNLIAPPAGVTTFVFGGTPQTGNIFIGNGSQTFNLTGNTNLVFASGGTTYYPDAINTGGQVLVLGDEILLNNTTIDPNTIPLTPSDYNNDQPAQGVLGYPPDPGNVNNDGVNDANRGFIDLQTSQQPALSCGIGGT